jgi:hypothetical protein
MNVNWKRFLVLMLPIKLRNSKLLFSLLYALTYYTRKKYDDEYISILKLIEELKYTSQVKLFVLLINRKFDQEQKRITITDGTEGNVSFFKEDELDESITIATGENVLDFDSTKRAFIVSNEETTVGEDFIINVPATIDKDKVKSFVMKYIFYGVGFKII